MKSSSSGRPTLGRFLFRLAARLRGSRSLEILAEIERAPFAPVEEVRSNQFRQLSALLAHSEVKVPYYRELFRGMGIASRDIRSLADFARLPTLSKDVVKARLRDFVRDDVPLASLMLHRTGGSTGIPLEFYQSRDYVDASDAGTYRNLKQCGWRPGEMVAFFWGDERAAAMPKIEFEIRQFLRRSYYFDTFHSGPEEMARWAARFRRLRPAVALGYASTVVRFAEFLEAENLHVPPLCGVYTTAEKLYDPQRKTLERVFGCHVFDCYGSAEIRNIAAECPHGRMHINADFVVLEIARPAFPGGPCPFVLTSLRNWTTPFIRYFNEDCGYLLDETCSCANRFPLMRLDIARINDSFVLPNGRVMHGLFFTHLMYGSEGVASFQFHQTARDHIVLWIVPGAGHPEGRQRSIREAVRQVEALSPGVHVEVRETAQIPLSSAGKHRFTRSDVGAEGTTAASGRS
jgi:phenylacetate-CoA ligase